MSTLRMGVVGRRSERERTERDKFVRGVGTALGKAVKRNEETSNTIHLMPYVYGIYTETSSTRLLCMVMGMGM